MRVWSYVLIGLGLTTCNSLEIASFNTPELCEPRITGIRTFTEAVDVCDGECQLCIESTSDDSALSYAVSHEDRCVCPAPLRLAATDTTGDAALNDATGSSTTADAGSSVTSHQDGGPTPTPTPAGDGCTSLLQLTYSQAHRHCDAHDDCHVCVERVNYDGEARSYMAHQCGCPAPYRTE